MAIQKNLNISTLIAFEERSILLLFHSYLFLSLQNRIKQKNKINSSLTIIAYIFVK